MKIVITGGAGFIGSNTASYYLSQGDEVVVFDNLSRRGSKKNLEWLSSLGGKFKVIVGDIRNKQNLNTLSKHVATCDCLLHMAAQVAVTTSVFNPREDFEINSFGTFNILELMRKTKSTAKFLYTSTNKVYGDMEDVVVAEGETRYSYKNVLHGISEDRPLDFHSPYGCSKGSADQYVRDYARIYRLDTVVFRQSCIYGPRQFGVEEQGWVAWFIIATVLGKQVTVYGNGKQVRDLLYIDDLVRAFKLALEKKNKSKGRIYNIGGGMQNTMSVWLEFRPLLEKLCGKKLSVQFADWRPGDQKVYISDIRRAKEDFGWEPRVSVADGIDRLYRWVSKNKSLFL